MKKGEIYEGVIEKIDFQNKGRVKIKDTTVTVKNGIPGQKVRFMINKKRGGRVEGRLLEVLEKSELEKRDPLCSIFPSCGGCMYQTMLYEEQLKMKEEQIKKLFDDAVDYEYTFEPIKGSPIEFAYRNKMEFSFGDEYKDGPLSLGLHKKGSTYDVLNAEDCKLVHEDMDKILSCVLHYFRERGVSYYHKMQHTGYLRHLLLRRGSRTGEILVNLVTTSQEEYDLEPLKEALLALNLEGSIVGILHIINDSLSDVVKSDETRLLYGQDYFYEELLELRFKITPFSFFQPNSRGAEILYQTVREYIGDTKDKVVFDLYERNRNDRSDCSGCCKTGDWRGDHTGGSGSGKRECSDERHHKLHFSCGRCAEGTRLYYRKTGSDHSGSAKRRRTPESTAEDSGLRRGTHSLYFLQTEQSCKRSGNV